MVKKIVVNQLISNEEIASMEGEYFDEKYFHTILNSDCDVYTENGNILLKFRKNVIDQKVTDQALEAYRKQAQKRHNNRGASAGVLDNYKLANFADKLYQPNKFRTKFLRRDGSPSKTTITNMAPSNIAGYFDNFDRKDKTKFKGKNKIPCRLTSFTRDHWGLWESSLPFLQQVDLQFQKLIPDNHYNQWIRANSTPEFTINETAFSTITLNYSWRTALHRDAGDYLDGFGNLTVIEDNENQNKYKGCYTGFPQYGVAVNVRTGDFLAMDVHEWHCNTEFIDINNNFEYHISKVKEWNYNRLSIVCYLRDNMIKCQQTQPNLKQLNKRYQELYGNFSHKRKND